MATDGASGSTDVSLSEPQQFTLPTLDGRYLRWFQSHIEDFKEIQQRLNGGILGLYGIWEIAKRIWADFPRGEASQMPMDEGEVQAIRQEAIGQGLGKFLELLPQLIAIFTALKQYWPQIKEILDALKGIGGTPTAPSNGGNFPQFSTAPKQ